MAQFDAIVVGARCAGSPTAMLLARNGYRVLLVDRATFPNDTISTHVVQPTGVGSLRRWGLLDRLIATGCPPIHTYTFDFGPFTIAGSPGTDDTPVAYCPRRTVLDKLLVDAAAEAGADVREGFTVEEVVLDDDRVVGVRGHGKDGRSVTDHARVVVGADGLHSLVAATVEPEWYREKPPLLCGYYSYWSDLPMDGRFDTYIRPERGIAVCPTHDDLTLVIAGWPYAEFAANKADIEGTYLKRHSNWHPLSPAACMAPPARTVSMAWPCPTISEGPTAQGGRWSATPDTTRTSSRRRASATRFGTPNCAPTGSLRSSPATDPSTTP